MQFNKDSSIAEMIKVLIYKDKTYMPYLRV